MQNKGLVRTLAVLLALVCAFYLSFSFVVRHYEKKAKDAPEGEMVYLDNMAKEKVWFGYTLKECREKEINLGLDLKGGMNVIMEVSVPDIVRALSGYDQSENFKAAMDLAISRQTASQDDFITLFQKAFQEVDPNAQLSTIFAKYELKDKISSSSSNEEVIRVLREETQGAIDNSFNVLRTRIDRFGVVQPNIQKLEQAGRILIELPGVKEPERVRKLLQGTANLEFWETYNLDEIYPRLAQINSELAQNEAATEAATQSLQQEAPKAQEESGEVDSLKLALEAQDESAEEANQAAQLETWKKQNPLFAILQPSVNQAGQPYQGPVVGTAHWADTAAINAMLSSKSAQAVLPRTLRLCWTVKAIDEAGSYYQLIALKSQRDGRPSLAGDVITDARSDFQQTTGEAYVSMSMNKEGAEQWSRLTGQNIGKSVAIVLDGFVYSFPTVQSKIDGGNSQITGHFTVEEAKDLANTLKSGKMPAPAHIVQEDVVGPSLGQEAIHDGLISFIIAFCLVLLYMIFYYGVIPGLIADAALLCNVFLLIGILCSFSAVLTLPGIAGIVLTLGMAVDANVLIYERIREEMKSGKNLSKAIQDGFKGAISAIVDSNVTSLLTGIVLAVFGTGPIRGFAVTFIIGIISSFFTAVFITRLLLEDYAKRPTAKPLAFTSKITESWFQNMSFNFIGARKVTYIVSGVLVVVGLLGLEPHLFGKLNLGIDFSGGRNYIIRFAEPVQPEEIRSLLEDEFDGEGVTVITIGNQNQVRVSTKYGITSQDKTIDEQIEARMYNGLKEKLGEGVTLEQFTTGAAGTADNPVGIMQSQKVGPSIADDIKVAAVWAIVIALIVIFLYILLRFRNVAFSTGGIVALMHDSIIILGSYALLWKVMPFSMEIDQAFIAAILTVIGYSINDTVVIFDRIREYNTLYPKREKVQNMNEALNVTLSRTFSTSMSTFVVLFAIFLFGGSSIRGFVFALLLGVIIGTYSSLFIATPIAYDIQMAQAKRKAKKAEQK